METIALKLQGMRCASCAPNIRKIVSNMDGIAQCEVNFGNAQANAIYEPSAVDPSHIQRAIAEAGYDSQLVNAEMVFDDAAQDAEAMAREKEVRDLRLKVGISGVIRLFLVIGGLPMMTGLHLPWLPA